MTRTLPALWIGVGLAVACDRPAPAPVTVPIEEPAKGRGELWAEFQARLADTPPSPRIAATFALTGLDFADVAPIIDANCAPCHRPGGNAPFSLRSHADVKRKAGTVRNVLLDRVMPPWMADMKYSAILDAPTITDAERDKIVSWIDAGLPPGAADASLPFSVLPEGIEVERVIRARVEKPHRIRSNSDSYECFILDPKLDQDTFVDSISFRSSNPSTVHHIMVFIDTSGIMDGHAKSWDCMHDGIVNKLVPIDSWSKGQRVVRYSGNYAYRFPRGSRIVLQTHYGDEGNKGKTEQTTIGLHLAPAPPRKEIRWEILNKLDLAVPRNTAKVETLAFPVRDDMALLGLVPHMHFVARMMEAYAVAPDGRKIQLLRIPDWDYLWQGRFMFPRPVIVPAGSVVYMNVLFDNTASNPRQPNDPIVDIRYDTYSNQEMMVLCLYYTPYTPGDENNKVGDLVR